MLDENNYYRAACAGCDSMALWAAFLTGIIAGGALIGGRKLLDKYESIYSIYLHLISKNKVTFL